MTTQTFINPSQVKAIVSAELAPLLVADGFKPIDPYKFVRSSKAPIREVVVIGFGKSECSVACGWSLSFMPVISGERLRWQRTEKSIRAFDVSRAPWDYDPPFHYTDWAISMMNDEAACRVKAKALAPKVVTYASQWWNRINTVEDVIDLVLSFKASDGGRHFGYWNLPRLQMTLAFASAFTGHREDARSALDEYFSHYSCEAAIKAALTKALDATGRT